MATKKPTIDDVATLSGVGRTTVSRVLNGGANVREIVRRRVMEAVAQLDYKVNMQARSLAGGGSRQLAFVYASDPDSEPNSYYHSGLELGMLRACADLGLHLLTRAIDPNQTREIEALIALIEPHSVRGVILTPPFCDNRALIERLRAEHCPVVAVSAGRATRAIASAVGIDDEAAGYAITRHLLDLGHRRFAYIKGLPGHLSAEERYYGFIRALDEAGVGSEEPLVMRGNFTFRAGAELAQTILDRPDRPSALICANDDMAVGALLTAHRLGLAIPDDISVTGFDDTPVSEIIWPPLTTVRQPLKTIGYRAVEWLSRALNEENGAGAPQFHVIAHDIVRRQSAGPPKPR